MYSFILLAQTRTGAALEIIFMLAVAALIGFITAYYYFRSQCRRELQERDNRIASGNEELKKLSVLKQKLEDELDTLKTGIVNKDNQIESLEIKLGDLRKKLAALESKPGKKAAVPKEKAAATLEKIRGRKHKIDYGSFGTASREQADDLTRIKGIGPWIQEKLFALDIYTFDQIGRFTPKDVTNVTEVIEFFPGRIERDHWVDQAKKLAQGK
jgi:predicted flap endonuclease-1-like 5' DNA nuclease